MIDPNDLGDINPRGPSTTATAASVVSGIPIPKVARVSLFSPDEWEEFSAEYGHSLKDEYEKVRRFGGTGDMGIDIACFHHESGFAKGWDNFQCKRYGGAIVPGQAWIEIGKIIYYSWLEEFPAPNRYFFCAPKGIATSLEKLLNDPKKLKDARRRGRVGACTWNFALGFWSLLSGTRHLRGIMGSRS